MSLSVPPAAGARARRSFLGLTRESAKDKSLADFELAESISADEIQILDIVAKGTTRAYRFMPRLEREFQQFMRQTSRMARLSIALLTLLCFASAPLWTPLLHFRTPQTTDLMLVIELVIMAPLFALVAFAVARWPTASLTEWFLIAAFVAEIACVEIVRYYSEVAGLLIPPSIAVVIPVAVLALTRISVGRSLIVILAYVATMLGIQWAAQEHLTARNAGTWMFEVLLLMVVFLSTVWNRLSFRRKWAAGLLLSLMAYRDSLTGLPNRRAFEDHYERAVRALSRGRTQRQLFALIDLDHFKKLNDRYGHEYGDGVLAEIGLVLAGNARRSLDMATRLGGEEFALLLYGCDAEAARQRLDELVRSVGELGIEHQDNETGHLTCSVGAVVVAPNCPLSEAYRAADALLYRAKREGRNRYFLEDLSGVAMTDPVVEPDLLVGNPT